MANTLLSALDSALDGGVTTSQLATICAALGFERKLPKESIKSLQLLQAEVDRLWESVEQYSRDKATAQFKKVSAEIERGDTSNLAAVDSRANVMEAYEAKRRAVKIALHTKNTGGIGPCVEVAKLFQELCNEAASRLDAEEISGRQKYGMAPGKSSIGAFLRQAGEVAVKSAAKAYPTSPRQRLAGLVAL